MGRSHKEILANLSENRRKRIETRSEKLKLGSGNEVIKGLIEAIKQREDPKLHEEASKIMFEQIDELMEMNAGEGPAADSEDSALLELLAEIIEEDEGEMV